MTRLLVRSLLGGAFATGVLAQDSPPRWIVTAGGGAGAAVLSCETCTRDHETSAAFGLGAVRSVGRGVALGVEGMHWSKRLAAPDGDADVSLALAMLVAEWRPAAVRRAFIRVGAGWTWLESDVALPVSRVTYSTNAAGYFVGAGYELATWGRVAFAPSLGYTFAPRARGRVAGTNSMARTGVSLLHAGLILRIRPD